MKILFINQSDHAIPPPPTVIRADTYISVPLAETLAKKGHEVTFLCPMGSTVNTEKIFTTTGPIVDTISLAELTEMNNLEVRTELLKTFHVDLYMQLQEAVRTHQFDLIHFHTNIPLSELVAVSRLSVPCLFTLHSVTRNQEMENRVMRLFNTRKENYFISISNYQRSTFPALPFLDTVYNGIQLENFPFQEVGGSRLLFAGRLRQSKGVKEAVLAALATQKEIMITGAVSSTDSSYFQAEIMPLVTQHPTLITVDTTVERSKLAGYYGQSKITLAPIQWEEPFGLVFIESMACGTPVVAFARGSSPEIIVDGKTGFLINPSDDDIRGDWTIKKTGLAGLQEAIERIYAMSEDDYRQFRKNCRTHVEEKFSFTGMVDHYEAMYTRITQ